MPELNKILRVCGPVDRLVKLYEFYSLDKITEIKNQFEAAQREGYHALILKRLPRRFQLSSGKIESLNVEPHRLVLEVKLSETFHPTIILVNFIDDIYRTSGITEGDMTRIKKGCYPGNMDYPSTVSIGPWKDGVTFIGFFDPKNPLGLPIAKK